MIILRNEDGSAMTPEDLSEQLLVVLGRAVCDIAGALPEAEFNGVNPVCPVCGEACRDTDVAPHGGKEWGVIDIGQSSERTMEHNQGEDTLFIDEQDLYGAMDSEVDTVLRCPNGHFLRFESFDAEYA